MDISMLSNEPPLSTHRLVNKGTDASDDGMFKKLLAHSEKEQLSHGKKNQSSSSDVRLKNTGDKALNAKGKLAHNFKKGFGSAHSNMHNDLEQDNALLTNIGNKVSNVHSSNLADNQSHVKNALASDNQLSQASLKKDLLLENDIVNSPKSSIRNAYNAIADEKSAPAASIMRASTNKLQPNLASSALAKDDVNIIKPLSKLASSQLAENDSTAKTESKLMPFSSKLDGALAKSSQLDIKHVKSEPKLTSKAHALDTQSSKIDPKFTSKGQAFDAHTVAKLMSKEQLVDGHVAKTESKLTSKEQQIVDTYAAKIGSRSASAGQLTPNSQLASKLQEVDTHTVKSEPRFTSESKDVDLYAEKLEPKLASRSQEVDTRSAKVDARSAKVEQKLTAKEQQVVDTYAAKIRPSFTSESDVTNTHNAKVDPKLTSKAEMVDTRPIADSKLTSKEEVIDTQATKIHPKLASKEQTVDTGLVKSELKLAQKTSTFDVDSTKLTPTESMFDTRATRSEPQLATQTSFDVDSTKLTPTESMFDTRATRSEPQLATHTSTADASTVKSDLPLTSGESKIDTKAIQSEPGLASAAKLKEEKKASKSKSESNAIPSELMSAASTLDTSSIKSEQNLATTAGETEGLPVTSKVTAAQDFLSRKSEPELASTFNSNTAKSDTDVVSSPSSPVDVMTKKSDLKSEPKVAFDVSKADVKSDTKPISPAVTTAADITNSIQQAYQTKVQNSEMNLSKAVTDSVVSQFNMPSQQQVTSPTVTLPVAVNNPQWQESLGQQIIMFNRQDIQKAEIKLHPEELGSLHIKLEMNDGKMQLNMAAAHGAVRGILESAIPHLRASLAEQGIDLQQTNISNSSMADNSNQQSMSSQQRNNGQGKQHVFSNDDVALMDNNLADENVTASGLSVFA